MANDLVQWRRSPAPPQEIEEDWNAPPNAVAQNADRDAADARQRGDGTFAFQREADAAEQHQKKWDWGDARTWIWIVGMCAGFLLLCAFVYFMPYGRHNQADLPAPVPTIRVY